MKKLNVKKVLMLKTVEIIDKKSDFFSKMAGWGRFFAFILGLFCLCALASEHKEPTDMFVWFFGFLLALAIFCGLGKLRKLVS